MNLLPVKLDGQQFSAAELNRITQEIEPPPFPSTSPTAGASEASQSESDFRVLARGNDTVYMSFNVIVNMFQSQVTIIGFEVITPNDWTIAALAASVRDDSSRPVLALVNLTGVTGNPEVQFQSDIGAFQFTVLCQATLVRN
jgi:hypothetical protein